MWILCVFLLLCLFLLAFSFGLLLYMIGRKKETDHENPTEKEKSWIARFSGLNEAAEKWWSENPVEKWTLTSRDGLKLVADYIPYKEESHRYAICAHGYTGDRTETRKYGAQFASWGINVLLPDNRAHGESEGRWIGMGYLDARDIQEWVGKIIRKDENARIFLFGVSMGGATVMMASGLDLPENVRFFVEDCGYSDVWEEFSDKIRQFHVPTFPLMPMVSFLSKQLAGYSFREASSLEALRKNRRPMIFIHGTTDTFVPYRMLDLNLKAAAFGKKEVLRVEGAGHALAVTKAKKEYFSLIKSFVDAYLA